MALIEDDNRVTFGEINRRADGVAERLILGGLKAGDHVAVVPEIALGAPLDEQLHILMEEKNELVQFAVVIIALAKIGARYVPQAALSTISEKVRMLIWQTEGGGAQSFELADADTASYHSANEGIRRGFEQLYSGLCCRQAATNGEIRPRTARSSNDIASNAPPGSPDSNAPRDMETASTRFEKELLAEMAFRVNDLKNATGITVGFVDGSPAKTYNYGYLDSEGKIPINGDSLFEIYSVTKVFSSFVLAQMISRGDLRVEDKISRLPRVKATKHLSRTRSVSLLDLVTHRSGFPDLLRHGLSKSALELSELSKRAFFEFLENCPVGSEPGAEFEYSNLNSIALGHILAELSGVELEVLMSRLIFGPLGMVHTGFLDRSGHTQSAAEAKQRIVSGASGLSSSINDLLKFIGVQLDPPPELAAAIQAQRAPRRATTIGSNRIAMDWFVQETRCGTIFWHSGRGPGSHAFLGFNPEMRQGVVILSNVDPALRTNDDLGFYLLVDRHLAKPSPTFA